MSRKYLMKGIAALALAFVAVSCNNDEDLFDPEASEAKAKYEAAFKAKFGEPAADHNWGFAPVQSNVTRAQDINENMWAESFYSVPEPLTNDQIAKVMEWFGSNHTPEGVAIDYKNFFFQNVGCTDNAKGMNKFLAGDEELNNMNAGGQDECNISYGFNDNINEDKNNRKMYRMDRIGIAIDGSTKSFGYKCSHDGDAIYRDYVVIPGEKIDASLAGRYFVGLDYHDEWNPESGNVALDGYYNDWVVCITDATLKEGNCRIIAEDLSVGEGGDFDFNDVVFDVKFIDNDNVKITLLAAGGTLPIYVGDVEVHEAFGVETNVMVNTGNGVTAEYVKFEMECPNHNWNANAVPVKVIKNGQEIVLEANVGKIPGKMCVETFYQWCPERQSIEQKYPEFTNYVTNQNVKWY